MKFLSKLKSVSMVSVAMVCVAIGNEELSGQLTADSLTVAAVADQEVQVPSGSPLTGAPFNVAAGSIFGFRSEGSFTVDWADEIGGVAQITGFSASFAEDHPDFGPYGLFAVGSGPGAMFSGELSNIVADSNNDLVSADMTISTTFSLTFFSPVANGAMLYTQDTATFEGRIATDGSGSAFASPTSPDNLDVFLNTGNVATDPLAAISFNRTVTEIVAVPEPSACGFVGLLGLALLRRKR